MTEATLNSIIGKKGLLIDGDWVESKDQDPAGDVRLIQLADIGDGYFIDKSKRFLTYNKAKELKCTFLQKGDILIARMPDPIGRACIFPGSEMPCVTVVDVCIIRPDCYLINPIWLKFRVNSLEFRNIICRFITGTTRQRISRSNLAKIPFLLPRLTVQNQIAALLSKAEYLIAQRKESIRLLDEFLKSTFLEMFGDPVRNEKGWRLHTIKQSGKVVTGTTPSSKKQGMFNGTIPFITPGDLESTGSKKRFVTDEGAKNSRIVREGATFVCCIGATIGKVGRSNTLSAFNQQINAIEWDKNFNYYFGEQLMRFMKSVIVAKGGTSTTLPILNKTEFEKIVIIRPPIELQNKFAEIVENVESIRNNYKESQLMVESLYSSLSQKAFKERDRTSNFKI